MRVYELQTVVDKRKDAYNGVGCRVVAGGLHGPVKARKFDVSLMSSCRLYRFGVVSWQRVVVGDLPYVLLGDRLRPRIERDTHHFVGKTALGPNFEPIKNAVVVLCAPPGPRHHHPHYPVAVKAAFRVVRKPLAPGRDPLVGIGARRHVHVAAAVLAE